MWTISVIGALVHSLCGYERMLLIRQTNGVDIDRNESVGLLKIRFPRTFVRAACQSNVRCREPTPIGGLTAMGAERTPGRPLHRAGLHPLRQQVTRAATAGFDP
jgi:hypothetical protein